MVLNCKVVATRHLIPICYNRPQKSPEKMGFLYTNQKYKNLYLRFDLCINLQFF